MKRPQELEGRFGGPAVGGVSLDSEDSIPLSCHYYLQLLNPYCVQALGMHDGRG